MRGKHVRLDEATQKLEPNADEPHAVAAMDGTAVTVGIGSKLTLILRQSG